MQLVWFKRDLRLDDHRPLVEANRRGPCRCLYVYEPEVFQAEEFDPSHLVFLNQCLAELRAGLRQRGGDLLLRRGTLPGVLADLHREAPFDTLWSHEETGTWATYQRDRRVRRWARSMGVAWHEVPQTGVVRRLRSRSGWAKTWQERMTEPLTRAPERITRAAPGLPVGRLRSPRDLGLSPSSKADVQVGGETAARATLTSFLAERGIDYFPGLSSPVTAGNACSRLSPYLAFGAIALRRVFQETERRRLSLCRSLGIDPNRSSGRDIRKDDRRRFGEPEPPLWEKDALDFPPELRSYRSRNPEVAAQERWLRSLEGFAGRLRWHCHFMQKLESQPRLEFENQSRSVDGLREAKFHLPEFQDRFHAWSAGRTGFPMVDACMRALHATGWINFRMRGMLMSFASYHLWLHWRPTALVLAQHFLDFEPGIHYPQAQMQSGSTGINSLRIYSPTKQLRDHDPTGVFVRRYVPELATVPDAYLAEPWRLPTALQSRVGCRIGTDYPAPIVDAARAARLAQQRLEEVRRTPAARTEAKQIHERHGSRKPAARRPPPRIVRPRRGE